MSDPRMRVTLAAVALAVAATARAQSPHAGGTAAADSVTTTSGVYTFDQANRGRDIYAGNCRSCHTPESHTGPVFSAIWNGRSLGDLFGFVSERMPKNSPGVLSPQEYVDVVAYLLRMNRLPMGDAELPADSSALAKVRIQLPP